MGSDESKTKGRVKRRNMIAKNMLENRRQFGERKFRDNSKVPPKFNKKEVISYDEKSYEGYPCFNPSACLWPDCGCE